MAGGAGVTCLQQADAVSGPETWRHIATKTQHPATQVSRSTIKYLQALDAIR